MLGRISLIIVVILWIALTLYNYYFANFFILAFEWLGLVAILGLVMTIQIVRLIKEWNTLTRQRILTTLTFTVLFLLTYFRSYPNRAIEKIVWILQKERRTEIVQQATDGRLVPNVSWNNWICELPFEFPVVSNGGNDIGIRKNGSSGTLAVTFWIFRNYFDSPSTCIVYTNDMEEIERIKLKIKRRPDENWQVEESWYRTYGE